MAKLGARKTGPGRSPAQPRGLPGTEEGPRFQVETWSEGGVHRLLIVAQGQGLATAYLAAKDDGTGVISTGSSLVEPCPSHHDRDVLGAAISMEPATALDMVALNAFEQVSPLPTRLLDVMTARAPTDMRDARRPMHAAPVRSTAGKYLDELSGRSRHDGLDVAEAKGREFGYHPLSNARLLVVDDGEVLSAPGRGARPGSVTLFSGHPGHAYVDPRVVHPTVTRALSEFTQLHGGWVMRMLDAKGWSTQTYAYFSAPGPVGERRRQAARLYQALAPVIARSETIRDLVDAGRPYERALRDRIALLLPADARKDFGVGGLRRMRGLLASTDFRQIEWAATMATRMPVDWLPTTGVGWQVFHERTRGVTGRLDDLGLEWSDYASVSGPNWAAFGVLEQDGKRPASSLSTVRSLSGAADMARHCGQTLLRPLNRALGLDDEDEDLQTKIEMLAASELLFAGKGHQADRRSDVYSLGVILYELLFGQMPFRGTRQFILHQVLREEPQPPRKINNQIPRDLETICLKAMGKSPARRYATARELAEDLRRYGKGEPVLARPVGQLERLGRWCRRNPAVCSTPTATGRCDWAPSRPGCGRCAPPCWSRSPCRTCPVTPSPTCAPPRCGRWPVSSPPPRPAPISAGRSAKARRVSVARRPPASSIRCCNMGVAAVRCRARR